MLACTVNPSPTMCPAWSMQRSPVVAVAQRDAPRRPHHIVELMGGDDDRGAGVAGLIQHLEEGVLAGLVEADEGLVHEEQGEGTDETQRDGGLLSQPSAEAGGQIVGP